MRQGYDFIKKTIFGVTMFVVKDKHKKGYYNYGLYLANKKRPNSKKDHIVLYQHALSVDRQKCFAELEDYIYKIYYKDLNLKDKIIIVTRDNIKHLPSLLFKQKLNVITNYKNGVIIKGDTATFFLPDFIVFGLSIKKRYFTDKVSRVVVNDGDITVFSNLVTFRLAAV